MLQIPVWIPRHLTDLASSVLSRPGRIQIFSSLLIHILRKFISINTKAVC